MQQNIELLDGKYTVVLYDDGAMWFLHRDFGRRNLAGDKLIHALATRILELEEEVEILKIDLAGEDY